MIVYICRFLDQYQKIFKKMEFLGLDFLDNEISERHDCGSMACQAHNTALKLYISKNLWCTALFFVCDRKELQDLLVCYVRERREICDSCENCFECEKLKKIRECLNDAYFYKKRTDLSYQPIHWKVFLFTFRDSIHFRLEILSVKHLW